MKNKVKILCLFLCFQFSSCIKNDVKEIIKSEYSPYENHAGPEVFSLLVDLVSKFEFVGDTINDLGSTITVNRKYFESLTSELNYEFDSYKFDSLQNRVYFLVYKYEASYWVQEYKTYWGYLNFSKDLNLHYVTSDPSKDDDLIYSSRKYFEELINSHKLIKPESGIPYNFYKLTDSISLNDGFEKMK